MTYRIETLGCKVNTYESDVIKDILNDNGYILDNDNPDICIINTCTVTNTADNKSGKMIRRCIKDYPKAIILVCGCYSQINPSRIAEIPGVDIIIGNRYKSKIIDLINEYKKNKKQIIRIEDIKHIPFEPMQLNNYDNTRAFVKIEDGCNNYCTYCIIPYSRGNVRSKNPKDVLNEVELLVKEGHHEIVLTGIHTGHYGSDLNGYNFYDLLNDLVKIKGLDRLRISSIELNEITDDIINLMHDNKVLVDHMHIPLQSGTDKILKVMHRKYDMAYYTERINKIRTARPDIAISTDVIVGFPGETDEDFNETINNIKALSFSKIHVFPYSVRKGTVAEKLPDQVDEAVKHERSRKLVEVSKELEINYMNKFIGKEIMFIPENKYEDGYLIGHTGNYLLIKAKGPKELIHREVYAKIDKIEYPYCQATLTNKGK